ncbi:MAG: pyruvate dehydrogenase E2 component (dihydrolipoamide acetyltransferase) [Candidatus Midichloriaceae bacterium]|jgi:pyruvate dehydrogenase E2 component (dihydrolipoamide acetyltransferase)
MSVQILMPALSPTMKEGNLANWLKKEGDEVRSGDIIAEIETDKAIMEVESADDGILAKILVPSGAKNVKVNDIIAILAEDGEDPKKIADDFKNEINIDTKDTEVKLTKNKETKSIDSKEDSNFDSSNKIDDKQGDRKFISPVAKRVALQKNIDINQIRGSGPRGRIVKDDLDTLAINTNISNVTQDTIIEISNMRQVIANKLLESKQQIPHFYLEIECVVDQLMQFRQDINNAAQKDKEGISAYKISINDMIIKATALSLTKHPKINSSWNNENIIQYGNIDISVAVAVDDGLITPIIRNANQKSTIAISSEVKDLAKRAKLQRLKPEEYQGGGFSISNLGMFDIKSFYAIINPPQSSIMSVGNIRKIAAFDKHDQLKPVNVMTFTLSCDHRVVDGATAAKFLKDFKQFIENPALMICY